LSILSFNLAKTKFSLVYDSFAAILFSGCPDGEAAVDTYSPKVIGGNSVAKGDIPWQVAITTDPNTNPLPVLCGGTLLNAYFIMTAAHCFDRQVKMSILNIKGIMFLALTSKAKGRETTF
jgi:secreted trypsin-like serine protease